MFFLFFIFEFQFLAAIAQNLLGGNKGLSLAFPTIVVPAVIGVSSVINPNESIHMTADEASWLGMILTITTSIIEKFNQ